MDKKLIGDCTADIVNRRRGAGGFTEKPRGLYRPDSTAWAALALAKTGLNNKLVEYARFTLEANQCEDGRISMPGAPGSFWPTPLAVLAWHGLANHKEAKDRALQFLLETTGRHWVIKPNSPAAHDTSLRGWPWIENTHSFIDPTSMALIALEIAGQTADPRFGEGIRMLMDRQLPDGGWNYGNTLVYGQKLHPFVDTTGLALTALAGHVAKEAIRPSLLFLRSHVSRYRAPLSLGWALFGLGAWGEFPRAGHSWIEETLKKQEKYGVYGTSLLSLLALASICEGDFRKCVV